MLARSAKAKGTKFEKRMAEELDRGFMECRRQPGSGIYQDFPHDLQLKLGELRLIGECKKHKNIWKTGERWMGAADFLVTEANASDPRIYMDLYRFIELIEEAWAVGVSTGSALPDKHKDKK